MAKTRASFARILSPTVALAALLLVASTATATVAVVKITGADVANGTLTGRDLKDHTVRGRDIADRSVRRQDLAKGALVPGPAGPTGAQGPAGASGLPDAWVEVGADSVLSPENDRVVAASVVLPAGSYLVTATASVVDPFENAPMGGNVTCSVRTSGGQVLAESVMTPAEFDNASTGLIHLEVGHVAAASTTLELYCLQGIGNVGVMRPTLTALAVGTLHG
jgi:hypothetical protein